MRPIPPLPQLTEELRANVVLEAAAEVESWFSRLDCLVVGVDCLVVGVDPLVVHLGLGKIPL